MGIMDKVRLIRSARILQFENREDLAGSRGELETFALIQEIAGKRGWIAYDSRRVPKQGGPGKYEIDILLVTPYSLMAFEVKQWGGEVEDLGNGQWQQITSRGDTRRHPCPSGNRARRARTEKEAGHQPGSDRIPGE